MGILFLPLMAVMLAMLVLGLIFTHGCCRLSGSYGACLGTVLAVAVIVYLLFFFVPLIPVHGKVVDNGSFIFYPAIFGIVAGAVGLIRVMILFERTKKLPFKIAGAAILIAVGSYPLLQSVLKSPICALLGIRLTY